MTAATAIVSLDELLKALHGIRARLADADFYFREDLDLTPDDRARRLGGIVFQERLGTLAEKTDRIVALVELLTGAWPDAQRRLVRRAAALAKSDLASGNLANVQSRGRLASRRHAPT